VRVDQEVEGHDSVIIDVTGEILMHPDKKVGLALGILLIGITGAFFFRNDAPGPVQETLTLTDPQSLDRKASQKPGAPYFPEPKVEQTDSDASSDLAGVPEVSAADVIPGLPRVGPTGHQGMLASPISLDGSQHSAEQFADRMAPFPSPGQDLDSLENFLSRNAAARRDEGVVSGEALESDVVADRGTTSAEARQSGTQSAISQPKFITHEVVAGDNLSRLAMKYLGSHSKYLTLFEANRDVLATPDDLTLGMKLKIPVKSSAGNASSSRRPSSSSTSTATAPANSSVAKKQTSPSFVQPDRAAVIALGGARRPGRSLSQEPPPNLPRVEGLNPGGDPAVIASRPKR
jgi:LysM repeat protein